jgi:hypothetical protein
MALIVRAGPGTFRCGREGLGDLVPGQHVVGGDVERIADRARVAEKGHETPGEIRVVRQGPQRREQLDVRLGRFLPFQRYRCGYGSAEVQ